MGCYDIVKVPCPKCGEEYYCQSKGGNCDFGGYNLENCPVDILLDVNRHAPYECECGTKFYVEFEKYYPDNRTISVKNVRAVEWKGEEEV
jgi:hypothetical protein